MSGAVGHRASEAVRKARKLAALLRDPFYRRALRACVPASVEHRAVAFEHRFASVVDLGANRGQFALFALREFPGARLHCFEPFPGARSQLARMVGRRPNVRIFDVAAGSAAGESQLHVSALDHSSSLLPITERLTGEFPGTHEAERVTVRTARLDAVLDPADLPSPSLLKIDVQGFELEALQGAEALLPCFTEILVEGSFVEFYAGQPLAGEVICHLEARGFRMAGVFSVMRGRGGECLQADFLFVNSRAACAASGRQLDPVQPAAA